MTILEHPLWPQLRSILHVQLYARDGGHAHPRHRFEVVDPGYGAREPFLAMVVSCCACGRPIHPVRRRKATAPGRSTLYLAVACDLDTCIGCSRGREAKRAYQQIAAAVPARPNGKPPTLPGLE